MKKFTLLCLGLMLAWGGVKAQDSEETQVAPYSTCNEFAWSLNDNGETKITLDASISFDEEWTLVGEFNVPVAFNDWGSSLIATSFKPVETSYDDGFQFYYGKEGNLLAKVGGSGETQLGTVKTGTTFTLKVRNNVTDKRLEVTVGDATTPVMISNNYDNLEDFSEMSLAIKAGSAKIYFMHPLNGDSYYRIISVANGGVLTAKDTYSTSSTNTKTFEGNNRGITHAENVATDLSAIWKYDDNDGNKKFRNANTNLLMGQCGNDFNVLGATTETKWSSYWEITSTTADPTILNLRQIGGESATNGYLTSTTLGTVSVQKSKDATGTGWKIKRITSVPLTLDDAGWASLVLPYNVVLPEGITAYIAPKQTVTSAGLTLTRCKTAEETKILPANTPVFLSGDNNTNLSLVITTDNGDMNIGENALNGATFRRHYEYGDDETSHMYGLHKNKGQLIKAGSGIELPANRAFVKFGIESTLSASYVSFNFDDNTTGIEEVPTAQPNAGDAVYYDLTGRRVANPRNGIFVNAAGKKVYFN